MAQDIALLDANIFYPAPLRDLFLQLAVTDLFQARWTADIHREWMEALLRNQPHRDRARLERTRDKIDQATRDCMITGYEALIPSLSLPDPDDRHVLAAAIAGHCNVIVTWNLTDFPDQALKPFGIDAQNPDMFLAHQFDHAPTTFCAAVRKVRRRLQNPPYTTAQYLTILTRQRLVTTVAKLEPSSELL